jgi:hypothetical protein
MGEQNETAEKWKRYACSYRYQDREYAFTIPARNEIEASNRIRCIGINGRIDGELIAEVPAVPGAGLFVRALCGFRNLLNRRL